MKDTWIILRIVLSLASIFALGIWVGRTTAPELVMPPSVPAVEFEADSSPQKLNRYTRRAMERYQQDLGLSPEQMNLLRPAFENATLQMVVLPKASRARREVIEDFHENMKPHLTPAQQKKAGEILEMMESRKQP